MKRIPPTIALAILLISGCSSTPKQAREWTEANIIEPVRHAAAVIWPWGEIGLGCIAAAASLLAHKRITRTRRQATPAPTKQRRIHIK